MNLGLSMKNVKKTEDLSCDQLRELLNYDPETGKLYWKKRSEKWFSSNGRWTAVSQSNMWNGRYAEKEALTCEDKKGYKVGRVFSVLYQSHRVIWCLVTGEWPESEIDHINGIRTDNKWENLREVNRAGNTRNLKRRVANTSGVTGVCWSKDDRKWIARINTDEGAQKHLGYFENFDEAVRVRKEAEKFYNYHENHGRD